jgi:hypothetical protein
VAPYRVDPLLGPTEPWDGANFALCMSCHDEAPFADLSGAPDPLTNFPGHGHHLGGIAGIGLGGDSIETPGDGRGNAVCAECHYALHALPTADRGNVSFSPNVEALGGIRDYDVDSQSCTLTCHGKEHDGLMFIAAP